VRLGRFCWTSCVVLWYATVLPLIIAAANARPRHSLGLACSDLALQVPHVTWQDDIPREEAADQEHRRRPKGDLGYCNHPIIHTIKDATSAP
jgi:hypothetical protein